MGKNKKGLAKGWIVAIVVGVIGIVVGAVIWVLCRNGVFLDCGEWEEKYCVEGGECGCMPTSRGGGGLEVLKPIIYLYPKSEMEVSVKLGLPEKLTVSYPLYENGWKVLARPDGRLTDLKTGRELYSLYWEGKDGDLEVTDEGFIVTGDEAIGFLEEKLAILGLNEREAEEFIVYWLPKMMENEYNYVRFATEEEISDYMPLKVSPEPDTVIRVSMNLVKVDAGTSVREQMLMPAPAREGFTVVEWGGNL